MSICLVLLSLTLPLPPLLSRAQVIAVGSRGTFAEISRDNSAVGARRPPRRVPKTQKDSAHASGLGVPVCRPGYCADKVRARSTFT